MSFFGPLKKPTYIYHSISPSCRGDITTLRYLIRCETSVQEQVINHAFEIYDYHMIAEAHEVLILHKTSDRPEASEVKDTTIK